MDPCAWHTARRGVLAPPALFVCSTITRRHHGAEKRVLGTLGPGPCHLLATSREPFAPTQGFQGVFPKEPRGGDVQFSDWASQSQGGTAERRTPRPSFDEAPHKVSCRFVDSTSNLAFWRLRRTTHLAPDASAPSLKTRHIPWSLSVKIAACCQCVHR